MTTSLLPDPRTAAVDPATPGRAATYRSALRTGATRWALVWLLIAFVIVFSILRPEEFATWTNARTILFAQSITALVALAALLSLLAGEIDISIGASMGIAAVFTAWAFGNGWPIVPAIVGALLVGLAVGAVNALLIVRLGINSFIATLAMTTVVQGLMLLITGGPSLFEGFPGGFPGIARNRLLGLPLLVVYTIVIAVALWFVVARTPFGRRLRATGSGREAAELIGVPTRRYAATALVLGAGLAAVAGVLQTAKLGSAGPTAGSEFMLSAIAAVFLGAIVSARGHLNVGGTLLAVLTLGVGITGLTMIGSPAWVPTVFNGLALLVALVLSRAGGRSIADGVGKPV